MGPRYEDKPAAGAMQVGLAALHLQRGDCASYPQLRQKAAGGAS